MPSASLAWLLEQDKRIAVSCSAPGCLTEQKAKRNYGSTLWPGALIRERGMAPETTLDDLRGKLKCSLCGSREHVVLEVIPMRPTVFNFGHTPR